jgi:uncharacterized membrane protein YoaK (UPF0700 family)
MNAKAHGTRPVPLLALAIVAGATDVAAFTRLGAVFASVMTGNLTLLGVAAAHASGNLAALIGFALVGYGIGVTIGTRIGGPAVTEALWPRPVTVILFLELVAWIGLTIGWEMTGAHPGGATQFALLADATAAMGLQAAAMRRLDAGVSTTYLTGTLTAAIASVVTGGVRGRQNGLNIGVLLAHVAGAATGGLLILSFAGALPILPLVALTGVIATGFIVAEGSQ